MVVDTMYLATKIGSEGVYLDKQVQRLMKNHRSTKSGRSKPVAGRSMEPRTSVWCHHKVSQFLKFVHHAAGPFSFALFPTDLKAFFVVGCSGF